MASAGPASFRQAVRLLAAALSQRIWCGVADPTPNIEADGLFLACWTEHPFGNDNVCLVASSPQRQPRLRGVLKK
jgi:hypothetical protein